MIPTTTMFHKSLILVAKQAQYLWQNLPIEALPCPGDASTPKMSQFSWTFYRDLDEALKFIKVNR